MIMLRLQAAARARLDGGTPVVEVLIAAHQGSAPRETGTRMLVTPVEVLGTIGGGHLEWKAIEAARQRLTCPEAPPQELDLPLGPALGQFLDGDAPLGAGLEVNEGPKRVAGVLRDVHSHSVQVSDCQQHASNNRGISVDSLKEGF